MNLLWAGTRSRGFTPPTANLELLLDASLLASAAALTTFPDTSGNARDATQANASFKPATNVATSPTGKVLASFDGVNDFMHGTLPGGGVSFNGSGYTFYFWVNVRSTAANQVLWQDETGGSPQLIVSSGSQKYAFRDIATNEFDLTITGAQRLTWRFPGTGNGSGEFYRNGVLIGNPAYLFSPSATGYYLGANQVGNAPMFVHFGEGRWYSVAHSATVMAQMDSYLQGKFG